MDRGPHVWMSRRRRLGESRRGAGHIIHLQVNMPILAGDCLTVSNGWRSSTGRTKVYIWHLCLMPVMPRPALLTNRDFVKKIHDVNSTGNCDVKGQHVRQRETGVWIQNSGRTATSNTGSWGGRRTSGGHGRGSRSSSRQPPPPRGQSRTERSRGKQPLPVADQETMSFSIKKRLTGPDPRSRRPSPPCLELWVC